MYFEKNTFCLEQLGVYELIFKAHCPLKFQKMFNTNICWKEILIHNLYETGNPLPADPIYGKLDE